MYIKIKSKLYQNYIKIISKLYQGDQHHSSVELVDHNLYLKIYIKKLSQGDQHHRSVELVDRDDEPLLPAHIGQLGMSPIS